MKIILLTAFSAFSLATFAKDCGQPSQAWRNCTQNSDCVLVDDPCGELHFDPAVNKKNKEEAQKVAYCKISEKACRPASGVKKAVGAKCENKLCIVIRK